MCETCVPTGTVCGNCGADPCYHLCFNSAAYYSPEQERHDDAFYGLDDVSERYAAERADMLAEGMYEDDMQPCPVPTGGVPWGFTAADGDDLPF